MQHNGQTKPLRRIQMQAEQPLLRHTVNPACKVKPRLSDGVGIGEHGIRHRKLNILVGSLPRVYSPRAWLDAATRETMRMYVDKRAHRRGIIMQMYGKIRKNADRIKYCADSY